MSDFYSLLKQSILDRRITDSGERDAIYAQARRAMIRKLWAFDPPLDEDEIEQRIGAFDVALSDVEADVVAAFRAVPIAFEEEYVAEPRYERDFHEREERPRRRARRLPAPARHSREADEPARGDGMVRHDGQAWHVPANEWAAYEDPYRQPQARSREPRDRGRWLVPQRPARPEAPIDPYYETEPGYDDEVERPAPGRGRSDRWSRDELQRRSDDLPRRRKPRRPVAEPRRRLSEADKIRLLLAAIGVFVVILAGVGVYVMLPRGSGGVAVDIGSRQVSDAATAVRIAGENLPVNQTFMLFDGRDPTIFEASPDNPIRFDANAGTVQISSSVGSPGVKALIGPGIATKLAGHEVRVTIVARSSPEGGAAGMRFAYQSGVAISHWQTANLGPDYQAVAMTWRVPALRTDRAGDLLVIQPGIPGDGTGADIKSIKIDLLAS